VIHRVQIIVTLIHPMETPNSSNNNDISHRRMPPTPSPDGCAICLEDYYHHPAGNDGASQPTISACVPCGHVFHTQCFARFEETIRTRQRDMGEDDAEENPVLLKCPVCQQSVNTTTRLYCTLMNPASSSSSYGTPLVDSPWEAVAAAATVATITPQRRKYRDRKRNRGGEHSSEDDEDGGEESNKSSRSSTATFPTHDDRISHQDNSPQQEPRDDSSTTVERLRVQQHHHTDHRRHHQHHQNDYKRLYRSSQTETWAWQAKYRRAVQDHTEATATERHNTAQATSLILLLQHQIQQLQATHQNQLHQVLALTLQREEALKRMQRQLQDYQQRQQRGQQSSSSPPPGPTAGLWASSSPPATITAAAATTPSSPCPTVTLLPTATATSHSLLSMIPTALDEFVHQLHFPTTHHHAEAVAAIIQYHQQKDIIISQQSQQPRQQQQQQGTTTTTTTTTTTSTTQSNPSASSLLTSVQQQHEEYLMIIHELSGSPNRS